MMRRLPLLALLTALAFPWVASAEVPVTLRLAWADAGQGGAARPAPAATLQVTELLAGRVLPVTVQPAAEGGATDLGFLLEDGDFAGPYARLRLAFTGLFLPAGDSRADQEMQFAVELVLRRDRLDGPVAIEVPVAVSSRKAALMPAMEMPQIAEELPQRFLLAQQYMSLNQASAEAVAAAPSGFALHRLIARALADFALELSKAQAGGVRLLPAPELARTVDLYWSSDPGGARQHLAAVAGARTALWADLREAERLLQEARRSGTASVALCERARVLVDFFDTHRPPEDDAGTVDRMFPQPGSLQRYLEGRRLDIGFVCGRPSI